MQNDANMLQRFLFDNLPIRGERIKLTTSWQEVLERREYPEVVKKYLGELVATAALLSATIKIEGKMTLQIEATGALNMLVVQITHDGGFR
ncbi:MAG: Hsp33 family molecular chaperone HslO, partial [Wohlfahrtiimonas sp.]